MLSGRVVLITGASSGIGRACATYFARAGAKILLCARRLDVLNELAAELKANYKAEVYAFKLDVRHHAEIQTALRSLPSPWQPIDILINNAGLALGLDFIQDGEIEDWETMVDTNIKGVMYMTHEILPQMVARNSGHIINLGSIAGHEVYPRGGIYCATKHAVHAFSIGLRMDLLGTKIRVSTVSPGAVKTDFSVVRFKGDVKRAEDAFAGLDALSADDIADAILYCASRPEHVNVNEIVIMPTAQASVGLVYRKSSQD